jgi:hypothetical protein
MLSRLIYWSGSGPMEIGIIVLISLVVSTVAAISIMIAVLIRFAQLRWANCPQRVRVVHRSRRAVERR